MKMGSVFQAVVPSDLNIVKGSIGLKVQFSVWLNKCDCGHVPVALNVYICLDKLGKLSLTEGGKIQGLLRHVISIDKNIIVLRAVQRLGAEPELPQITHPMLEGEN
jgi:hypothetical protein